jgi:hypothetical protein
VNSRDFVKFALSQFSAAVLGLVTLSAAYGQETKSGEYAPPIGEQPVYGKRYTPGASEAGIVMELNIAQLLNKGVGLEFEKKGSGSMNFGADLSFTDKSVSTEGGASGQSRSVFIAPKIRLYPMEALQGVFFGGKLHIGQVTTNVTISGKSSEKNFNVMAPTVHIGYRFLSTFGFTWSLYGGAGINFPRPKFETKDLADQNQAAASNEIISKVNDLNKDVRLDLGLTAGIAL